MFAKLYLLQIFPVRTITFGSCWFSVCLFVFFFFFSQLHEKVQFSFCVSLINSPWTFRENNFLKHTLSFPSLHSKLKVLTFAFIMKPDWSVCCGKSCCILVSWCSHLDLGGMQQLCCTNKDNEMPTYKWRHSQTFKGWVIWYRYILATFPIWWALV